MLSFIKQSFDVPLWVLLLLKVPLVVLSLEPFLFKSLLIGHHWLGTQDGVENDFIFWVASLSDLLTPGEVKWLHLKILWAWLVTSNLKLLAKLDVSHRAQHLGVFKVDLLKLSLCEGILGLGMHLSSLGLLFACKKLVRGVKRRAWKVADRKWVILAVLQVDVTAPPWHLHHVWIDLGLRCVEWFGDQMLPCGLDLVLG